MLRGLKLLGMVLTLFALSVGPAIADCHSDGDNTGSYAAHEGAGKQDLSWTLSTRTASVSSTAYSTMSTDICLDALVDWMTTSGHYDARDARNCKPGPNSYRSGSIIEPSDWGGRSVTGLQKAAGCKYIQTTSPSTYGTCDYAPETPAPCKFNTNDAHPWYTKGHAVWLRRQDGTIEFNDGGNVQSPDS